MVSRQKEVIGNKIGFEKMNEILEIVDKAETEEKHENIKIEKLREKYREQKLVDREHQREFLLKKARFLEIERNSENFIENDITVLAKSLKNKSQVSCELLNAVMNALLDSKENIRDFLKVDGALQALLRLLSGQNEKFQLIAAQCICNLALGNEKQSMQVLKAAESYLMVHLSGRNQYLKEVCAVALGNLSRQGVKNIELLMNQGFLPKILNLLNDNDSNLEAAAINALVQLIYHGFDVLKPEDLQNCLLTILPVFNRRSYSVAFLLTLLSSYKSVHHQLISSGVHLEALKCLLISLQEKEKEAVYFLRIVSNLSVEVSVAKNFTECQNYIVEECISYLLKSEKDYLKKECLSWLGNIMNHPIDALKLFGVEVIKKNFELIMTFMKSCEESFPEETLSAVNMDES